MNAISLMPPWGTLCALNLKDVENRNWKRELKGRYVIHQSKRLDREAWKVISQLDHKAAGILVNHDIACGALIGEFTIWGRVSRLDAISVFVDHVSGITRYTFLVDNFQVITHWFFGKYGYMIKDAVMYPHPVPWKGQLMVFPVPDEVIAKARAGL